MPSEQHDDHCWVTWMGEGWAIWSLKGEALYLWRGYWPEIEWCVVDWPKENWQTYAEHAARKMMEEQTR